MKNKFLRAGVLTDPLAPHSFGAWIQYVANNHTGAISFLIADFFLFFGVFTLTVVQASQVCLRRSYLFFSFMHKKFSPLI